jgi:hypothetical protein
MSLRYGIERNRSVIPHLSLFFCGFFSLVRNGFPYEDSNRNRHIANGLTADRVAFFLSCLFASSDIVINLDQVCSKKRTQVLDLIF